MKILTIEQQTKPRSRRLRKKLHLGEFQEFGFTIAFNIDLHQKSYEDALDNWIDYVESQSWCFGGGGSLLDNRTEGYLCQYNNRAMTMTESDREEAGKWLAAQPWVLSHQVAPLSDAWYGPWEE